MAAKPWEAEWSSLSEIDGGGQGKMTKVASKSDSSKIGVVKELKNKKSIQARSRMYRETVNLETLGKAGVKVPAVLGGNVHEYGDVGTHLYFVMEFIQGETLRQYMEKRGPLPMEEAIGFILDLGATVKSAHQNDVIHRDLKPDNIIVRNVAARDLVIIDYGLSFNHKGDDGTVTRDDETFRNEFIALPETNTDGVDNRDKRSDIAVLSALLYYCLTGRRIGQLQDGQGKLVHRREGQEVRLGPAEERYRRQIDLLLDRGMAVEMQNRFQTCDELRQRLIAIRDGKRGPSQDPVAAAAQAVNFLRRHDLETQKEAFGGFANHILQQISAYVDNSRQALGDNFQLIYSNETHNDFPSDLPLIAGPRKVIVKLMPHRFNFSIHYAIACSSGQCLFMRKTKTSRDGEPVSTTNRTDWGLVLCYDPVAATDTDAYVEILKDDISEAIECLRQQAVPSA